MTQENKGKKFLIGLAILLLIGASGVYLYYAEGEAPSISIQPEQGFISDETSIQVEIADKKSGLKGVLVQVRQKERSITLVEERFDKARARWSTGLQLKGNRLADAELSIHVEATDRSWVDFWRGNRSQVDAGFVLDTKPPQLSLESYRHNLNQGGSGLVGFRTNEEVASIGVQVGDFFFPGYAQPNGMYLAMFSYPYNLQPGKGDPVLQAKDRAGNVGRMGFNYYVNDKRFPHSTIRIPDSFLQRKMMQFQDLYPESENLLDLFLKVNRDLRGKNRQELKEIGRETSTEPLWDGRFLRQPGARKSAFGARRTYYYQGEKIDDQTHLGVDIASVARSKVMASNSGRVVHAGWMGIYGQSVIIDHGLGLQSLYGHLSKVSVQPGDSVSKGQTIGRTGATGLAGGDHLHYAILISGVPVNPVEWWDLAWIENNIYPKLSLVAAKAEGEAS